MHVIFKKLYHRLLYFKVFLVIYNLIDFFNTRTEYHRCLRKSQNDLWSSPWLSVIKMSSSSFTDKSRGIISLKIFFFFFWKKKKHQLNHFPVQMNNTERSMFISTFVQTFKWMIKMLREGFVMSQSSAWKKFSFICSLSSWCVFSPQFKIYLNNLTN